MVDRFYREFEAAFRGHRAEILQRLEVYRDFLTPLARISAARQGLDLGCGRGEWLELLGHRGFAAHGVDLDAGMLEDCFARGLSAEQGDAIACLKAQPDHSQAVVSGFHLAEHLPFALLQELIAQALRVLEPGGLLILETPNPENIRVGSMTFHMDPTHNKPLPPGLLSFLARHYGFARVQVLRLQESPALRGAATASLAEVFEGVSPDYAIVAQKQSDAQTMALFDAAFAADRGLTLETLSQRFEAGMVRKAEFDRLRAEVADLNQK
ncbi:MAG: class SAM-dependent methyltransferase, partial [Devosia sp.]|nr:class SAM-dependent methyltransferase [Devosia sp.]